jgi:hypothetical protein
VEVEDQRPSICAEYQIREAEKTADVLRIGEVTAGPGGEVAIPVYVTSDVPIAGIQLVVAYDPALLEIRSGHEERKRRSRMMEWMAWRDSSLSFEDTDYGEDTWGPALALITTHPDMGIFALGIVASFVLTDQTASIPPGEDRLVAWIHATVSGDATPGTVISLVPTSGLDGKGIGPYRMRSEICYQGEARLVALIPDLQQGTMAIVGDQAFFRGDSNGDETLGLSDAIHTLGALFLSGLPLTCKDAADSNDDGKVDVSDAIHTLSFLFLGGPQPPPPYPEAGFDPTADALHCYRVRRQ